MGLFSRRTLQRILNENELLRTRSKSEHLQIVEQAARQLLSTLRHRGILTFSALSIWRIFPGISSS
jgi:hypothetical protein